MKKTLYFIRFVIGIAGRIWGRLEERRIRVYASQAAFFIVISSIPAALLVISVLGAIIPDWRGMAQGLGADSGDGVFYVVAEEVYGLASESSTSLISVSAITLLWSASAGMRGIGGGVRNVYGGERDRPYLVYLLKSLLMTVLYILSVVLALTVWVFGDMILKRTSGVGPIGLIKVINSGALFMLLSAVFMMTYRFFGGRREISEAPGAFIAAAGWFLYSAAFEYYVEHFIGSSYLYGGLGALTVVMLWLYSCMEILLIGAAVNVYMHERSRRSV